MCSSSKLPFLTSTQTSAFVSAAAVAAPVGIVSESDQEGMGFYCTRRDFVISNPFRLSFTCAAAAVSSPQGAKRYISKQFLLEMNTKSSVVVVVVVGEI